MSVLQNFKDILIIDNIPKPIEGEDEEFSWSLEKVYQGKNGHYDSYPKLTINPDNKYIPKVKDKLYFYPACDVPRFKVREWGKKNNITITVKEDNATAKFGSKKSVYECVNRQHGPSLSPKGMLKWIEDNYDVTQGRNQELLDMLEHYQEDIVYLGPAYYGYTCAKTAGYGSNDSHLNGTYEQEWLDAGFTVSMPDLDSSFTSYDSYSYSPKDKWQDLMSLATDPTIYSQEEIIGVINEDSTIITSEIYEELRTMLGTEDRKNVVLAMEIIASSHLKLSCHYVMLLLQEFCEKMYNTKERGHVNFKSMLEYLKIKSSWTNITDDIMIETLADKDALTMTSLKELADAVKTKWENKYNTKHFKINTITVSDDIQNYFLEKIKEKQEATQETLNIEE